jgi:Txe/YoeB family toxin of toxin-antitoxin system
MVEWKIVYTKQAQKDAKKISSIGLKTKVQNLLSILQKDPFQIPPPFEKLVGDLTGTFSRRINIQHRLVYQIYKKEKTVKIIRMWTHYE